MATRKYDNNFIFNITMNILCLIFFITVYGCVGNLTQWIFVLTVLTYINTVKIYNIHMDPENQI